jgi:hypothetical protein
MSSKTSLVLAAAAAALAVRAASRSRRRPDDRPPLAASVFLPIDRLRAVPLPEPLAALGDAVEVSRTPAPGDRGTEVRVRVVDRRRVPRERARLALRQAKELLETGEVQPPDEPVTRRRTLASVPLEAAVRRAGRAGRL